MSLIDRDRAYVWHPFTQAQVAPDPIPIASAEGVWLYTTDGKKYLDANSSWWTIVHGHGNKHIADAIHQQFLTADHLIFAGATHSKAVEVAERMVNVLPKGFQKVFFSDN